MRQHLGLDLEPVDTRRSDLDRVAFMQQQDSTELHGRSRLGGQPVDQHAVSRGNPILLTAADDDSRQRSVWLGHGEAFYQVL